MVWLNISELFLVQAKSTLAQLKHSAAQLCYVNSNVCDQILTFSFLAFSYKISKHVMHLHSRQHEHSAGGKPVAGWRVSEGQQFDSTVPDVSIPQSWILSPSRQRTGRDRGCMLGAVPCCRAGRVHRSMHRSWQATSRQKAGWWWRQGEALSGGTRSSVGPAGTWRHSSVSPLPGTWRHPRSDWSPPGATSCQPANQSYKKA